MSSCHPMPLVPRAPLLIAGLLTTGLGCSSSESTTGGGSPSPAPAVDAGVTLADAGASEPDAGETVDAGPSYATCPSADPFNVVRSAARPVDFDEDGTIDGVMGFGLTSSDYPFDVAAVRIDRRFGGPTEPGLYTLDGANWAECTLCVFV